MVVNIIASPLNFSGKSSGLVQTSPCVQHQNRKKCHKMAVSCHQPYRTKCYFCTKITVMGIITYEAVISHIFEIIALILVPLIIIGCLYFSALGLYRFFKGKTKKELLEDNARLLEENQQLKEKNAEMSRRLEYLENLVIQNERQKKENAASTQLINVGTLKVRSNHIAYIVSQSFELITNGNSRIKVIHYTDTPDTDSVYATFDSILEQLNGNFMLINKNQIINLREIDKIQGNDVYLKGFPNAFVISDTHREQFDIRISCL